MDTTSTEITGNTIPSIATDFDALLAEGIRMLQEMAGDVWTDYNLHDPGITILEQVCYALTDLAYRIGHPIPDLLAGPGEQSYATGLYKARGIMNTNPVTSDDYRKLLIGIDGVRNAHIALVDLPEPLLYKRDKELILANMGTRDEQGNIVTGQPLKGLFRVKIEPDGTLGDSELYNRVAHSLMASRNLGEDFIGIEIMKPQLVVINAELEVGGITSASQLLAQIYDRLRQFVAPDPVFYSLKELLSRGYTTDEAMDGPILEKGYLDPVEFKNFTKKEYIRGSDVISVLSEIPGVRFVKSLSISLLNDDYVVTQSDPWSVTLDKDRFPRLYISNISGKGIDLMQGNFTLNTSDFVASAGSVAVSARQPISPMLLDVAVEPGRYRSPGEYQSIQHYFPLIYGVGEGGLANNASEREIANVKQLKAYLLFFDQVLSNAFAQLEGFGTLMSGDNAGNKSRFRQVPDDVPGLDVLLINGRQQLAGHLAAEDDIVSVAANKNNLHRVADHLLSRVGEQIFDYRLLHKENADKDAFLNQKKLLLAQYQELSFLRGTAADYSKWGLQKGLPALHRRLAVLLDISADTGERFYLVEHQLLRPLAADVQQYVRDTLPGNTSEKSPAFYLNEPTRADVFSLQVSYVFPESVKRFRDPDFRRFAEQMINAETPAHLVVHLYWMQDSPFASFEKAYKDWEDKLSALAGPMTCSDTNEKLLQMRIARNCLIDSLKVPAGNKGIAMGDTWPVIDIPAESVAKRIQEGEAFQATIGFSQSGVLYQLWDRLKQDFSGVPVKGNGGTVVLKSAPMTFDKNLTSLVKVEFDISAVKQGIKRRAWLKNSVSADFRRLEWQLKVEIVGANEIVYDGKVVVRIHKPQTGVHYTLYTSALTDSDYEYQFAGTDPFTYSIRKSRFIENEIAYLKQDAWTAITEQPAAFLDIVVPAEQNLFTADQMIKIGAGFGGANPLVEYLDERVCVFAGPDPNISVTEVAGDPLHVLIPSPQPGVLYTLLSAGIPFSSGAWLPGKGIADKKPDAEENLRIAVNYVLNATTAKPVIMDVPPFKAPATYTFTAQKLNTRLMATLSQTVTINIGG